MAKYKYTSNKDSQDGTEVVVLENGEELRVGEEAELGEEEVAALRERFNLREVDGGEPEQGQEEASEVAPESSQKAPRG